MICEEMTKGSYCTHSAKWVYKGKKYCFCHFKKAVKNPKATQYTYDTDSDDYDEFIKPKKQSKPSRPPKPFKPTKPSKPTRPTEHADSDSDEYDEYESKYPPEWSRPTKIKKKSSSPILTPEAKDLMNLINSFLKAKLNADELKKQGRAILRKIHPDKCRIEGIDSHTLTQKVIKHMQKS